MKLKIRKTLAVIVLDDRCLMIPLNHAQRNQHLSVHYDK